MPYAPSPNCQKKIRNRLTPLPLWLLTSYVNGSLLWQGIRNRFLAKAWGITSEVLEWNVTNVEKETQQNTVTNKRYTNFSYSLGEIWNIIQYYSYSFGVVWNKRIFFGVKFEFNLNFSETHTKAWQAKQGKMKNSQIYWRWDQTLWTTKKEE